MLAAAIVTTKAAAVAAEAADELSQCPRAVPLS